MDDLISRQETIEAVEALAHHVLAYVVEGEEHGFCTGLAVAERQISLIPSVQPEIIRCKDCKHGRPYKHTTEYVACEVDCEPIDRDSDFYCADAERREDG